MTPGANRLLFMCACALLLSATGCKGDGDGGAPTRSNPPEPAPMAQPENDPPPDLNFPDTLCGALVGRLLECEIERVQAQSTLRDSEKASVITHKRRTFARKRDQYLAHCEGKVAGLAPEAVRACLPQPCVEMDRCLQKIAGQTNPK